MYYHPSQFGETGNATALLGGMNQGIDFGRLLLAQKAQGDMETDRAWQRQYNDNVFSQSQHVQNAELAWRQAEEQRRAQAWDQEQAFRRQMTPIISAQNLALTDEIFGTSGMDPMMGGAPDPNALPAQGAPPVAPHLPTMPGNLAGAVGGGGPGGGQMAGLGQLGAGTTPTTAPTGMQTPGDPFAAAFNQLHPRQPGMSPLHAAARSMAMNGDFEAQNALFNLLGDERMRASLPHIIRRLESGSLSPNSIGDENLRAYLEALSKFGDAKTVMSGLRDVWQYRAQQDAAAQESEGIAQMSGLDPMAARKAGPRATAALATVRERNAGRPRSAQEALMNADPNEIERATQMLQSDDQTVQAQGRAWFAKTAGRLPAGKGAPSRGRGIDPTSDPEKFQAEMDRQIAVLKKRYPKATDGEIQSMAFDRTQYGRPVNESGVQSRSADKGWGGERVQVPMGNGKAAAELPKGGGKTLKWDETNPIVAEFKEAAVDLGAVSRGGFMGFGGKDDAEFDAEVEKKAKALALRAGWRLGDSAPSQQPATAQTTAPKPEPKAEAQKAAPKTGDDIKQRALTLVEDFKKKNGRAPSRDEFKALMETR